MTVYNLHNPLFRFGCLFEKIIKWIEIKYYGKRNKDDGGGMHGVAVGAFYLYLLYSFVTLKGYKCKALISGPNHFRAPGGTRQVLEWVIVSATGVRDCCLLFRRCVRCPVTPSIHLLGPYLCSRQYTPSLNIHPPLNYIYIRTRPQPHRLHVCNLTRYDLT